MKVIEVADYSELSKVAANIIINSVRTSNSITLGLATGGTMLGVYEMLIKDFRKNQTSYQHVYTFNLDEYVGLGSNHPNSYHYYMREKLFNHIDIPEDHIFIPDGTAEDLEYECYKYESEIQKMGGIDLQILGIGSNGHIGFNEPLTPFQSMTHVVQLASSTRIRNSRYFSDMSHVPTHAITMGIASIMQSKQIVLLASGIEKAEIMEKLFYGKVDESIPASILKKHFNVTILADYDALKNTKKKDGFILYD